MSIVLRAATEQLALLRQGKISPLELAEEHIRQIERLNPCLNAIVDFDAERVREQASRASGGRLAGLPVTIKSSISVAGYRCELGSRLNRGSVAEKDAELVQRLRNEAAVILGTTNCPEFLMAYETDNLLYGKTRNPWSLEHTAGGSSGGESAAIAAGLSPFGLGSDSGGSVRTPAHFTGICSLKPTPGRFPAEGHLPPCVGPFSVLGAIGPMARTVADLRLLFDVLSGQDPMDPTGVPLVSRTPTIEDAKQISIGWFEDDGLTPVTPETRQAVRDTVRALDRQGFRLTAFRPDFLEEARRLWHVFFVQCGAMFLGPAFQGREDELSPTFRGFLEIAQAQMPLSAESLLSAWAELDLTRRKLLAEMQRFPILICPVCAIPAFRFGEREWTVEDQPLRYLDAVRYTQWFNVLGSPAAVVPVASSREGLPIGVQIAGRPFEDELVLAVAAAVDRDFGFRPPSVS